MSLSNFKVLTFDVVGTLIDFERGMLDYLRRAVPDATVSDDDFLAAYRNARASANCGAFPDDLERVWNEVAVAVGLPDTPELARGLRDSAAPWPARLRRHAGREENHSARLPLPQPRSARRRCGCRGLKRAARPLDR